MSKSVKITKRRFEIVGHTLDRPGQIPVWRFAEMYKVDDVTVKRDLAALRKKGIDIHSVNNEGVIIRGEINRDTLLALIPEYIGITYSVTPYRTATDHLLNLIGQRAVRFITVLQRAIERKEMIYIEYANAEKTFDVEPVNIYQNEEQWYLIAKENRISRLIEIAKIAEIRSFAETAFEEKRYLIAPSRVDSLEKIKEEQGLIMQSDISFPVKRMDRKSFYSFRHPDILRDDYTDYLIDLRIDNMLNFLRGKVEEEMEGDIEKLIKRVIEKIRGDSNNEKEVSIPLLLDSIKKLLS